MIDFIRAKDGVPAKVAAIQYDPNRTARIALLHYVDADAAAFVVSWLSYSVSSIEKEREESETEETLMVPNMHPVDTSVVADCLNL